MSEDLVEFVSSRLDRLAPREGSVLVAVSGGPDSLALLDLLHRGQPQHQRRLIVVHVDHGIQRVSSEIASMVAREAGRRDLECVTRRLSLGPDTSETRARMARRHEFRQLLAEGVGSSVALAHHADDQVETVLLRFLKGSGPAGLAGMAPRRGPWLRPLLEIRRAVLEEYCLTRGLPAWQDPANRDSRHLRSWLRTVALPLLRSRMPDVDDSVQAAAQLAREHRIGVNELPESLTELDFQQDSHGFSVAAPVLVGYSSGLQSLLLAALGRRAGVPLGAQRLAAVRQLIAGRRSGAKVRVSQGLVVELSFDRLHFRRPEPPMTAEPVLPVDGEVRHGRHRLRVVRDRAIGSSEREGREAWLALEEYRVRSPRPGDRLLPLGGTGRRPVAVLMREARVPAGQRTMWPMVVLAADPETIVWVPGICRSAVNVPEPGEDALHVTFDLT